MQTNDNSAAKTTIEGRILCLQVKSTSREAPLRTNIPHQQLKEKKKGGRT